jgi:hypothetical protein
MPNADTLAGTVVSVLHGKGDVGAALLPVVKAVAGDPERYAANYHVLGFLHCRLGESEGHTVRLHIWPSVPRIYAEPVWAVHTHHWTIDSAVIAGHVLNETFEVNRDDQGPHELYEVAYLGDGLSERRRTGQRVSMVRTSAERWEAGQRYEIPLETYHSTTVPEGLFAATVIVTGLRSNTSPLVVGDASGGVRYRYGVQAVSLERWSQALTELTALLEA